MSFNLLLLESLSEGAMELLEKADDCRIYSSGEDYDPREIDGVLTRGKGKVDLDFLESHSRIRVIARCGVGLDNIAVERATQKGIQVLNTPGINAQTVAEHTFTLLLMLQRQINTLDKEVKKGNWSYRATYSGDEVYGKTLGILGMGNIGQRVAAMAAAFGMKIKYWSKKEKPVSYSHVDLQELLVSSDMISIHLPLNEETRKLINNQSISKMKAGVLLINTARGAIVAEEDLIAHLESGQIKGYATDVLEVQPPPVDHPFLTMENVIVTPHAASLTRRTFDQICQLSVENVLAYLRKESVQATYIVNKV